MHADYIYSTTSEKLSEKIDNLPLAPDENEKMYFLVENISFCEDKEERLEGNASVVDENDNGLITEEDFVEILKSRYKEVNYIGFDVTGEKIFYLYSVII